jgi:aminopeptidase-like protein
MQLMALADGTRSLVALAEAVNYPQQRTDALVECLRKTGALL